MHYLIYRGKKLQALNPEQAQKLKEEFLAERDTIFFAGQVLKTRNIEITCEQEEVIIADPFVLHQGKKIPQSQYLKLWNAEQERLKALNPNQKATLNFEKKFVWKYLAQIGATKVLGENWKVKNLREIVDEVEGKLLMANPEKFEKLMAAMREFFETNPTKIWCDELLKEFLPRGGFMPEIIKSL
ncbi:MAG: hypothetical protein PHQ20_03665 [Candidatus Moranbacteria bacterium]|nr:hypothetical protein [Candidatus Moranbacteria bacterium]